MITKENEKRILEYREQDSHVRHYFKTVCINSKRP